MLDYIVETSSKLYKLYNLLKNGKTVERYHISIVAETDDADSTSIKTAIDQLQCNYDEYKKMWKLAGINGCGFSKREP